MCTFNVNEFRFHVFLLTQHERNALFLSRDRKYVLEVQRFSEVCLFVMKRLTSMKF